VPRTLWLIAVVFAALTVVGCGGSGDDASSTSAAQGKEDCALLANGNKLCGDDLVAYCNGFADREDPETRRVCINADDAIEDGANENQRKACAAYEPGSVEYRECLLQNEGEPAKGNPDPGALVTVLVDGAEDSIGGIYLLEVNAPSATITGTVDPPDSELRLLRRRTGRGWVKVDEGSANEDGEFEFKVSGLTRGENGFRVKGSEPGHKPADVLVTLDRR
jgi:hypothetical protein